MSALGTRPLDPADVGKVVAAGVDTFLRAFGTDPSAAAPKAGGGG
ncbi:hypothetical protein [Streptomyces sp. NPDC058382]